MPKIYPVSTVLKQVSQKHQDLKKLNFLLNYPNRTET